VIIRALELLHQDDKQTYDELSQEVNSVYHHIVTLGDSKLLVSVVTVIKMASDGQSVVLWRKHVMRMVGSLMLIGKYFGL
jgi:hypothetical protein